MLEDDDGDDDDDGDGDDDDDDDGDGGNVGNDDADDDDDDDDTPRLLAGRRRRVPPRAPDHRRLQRPRPRPLPPLHPPPPRPSARSIQQARRGRRGRRRRRWRRGGRPLPRCDGGTAGTDAGAGGAPAPRLAARTAEAAPAPAPASSSPAPAGLAGAMGQLRGVVGPAPSDAQLEALLRAPTAASAARSTSLRGRRPARRARAHLLLSASAPAASASAASSSVSAAAAPVAASSSAAPQPAAAEPTAVEAASAAASSASNGRCCVCLEAENTPFVPCGHQCVCFGCGAMVMGRRPRACPLCKVAAKARCECGTGGLRLTSNQNYTALACFADVDLGASSTPRHVTPLPRRHNEPRMPRLAANLSFLFKEHTFLDRFKGCGLRFPCCRVHAPGDGGYIAGRRLPSGSKRISSSRYLTRPVATGPTVSAGLIIGC